MKYYLSTSTKRFRINGQMEDVWAAKPYHRIEHDTRAVAKIESFWGGYRPVPIYFTLTEFTNNAIVYAIIGGQEWTAARGWQSYKRFELEFGTEIVGHIVKESRRVEPWTPLDIQIDSLQCAEIIKQFENNIEYHFWSEWSPTRLYFRRAADATFVKLKYS